MTFLNLLMLFKTANQNFLLNLYNGEHLELSDMEYVNIIMSVDIASLIIIS